jgi:hypothetical protein
MAASLNPSEQVRASVRPEDEEDRLDLEEGLSALQAFRESGERAISLAEVKAKLNLD